MACNKYVVSCRNSYLVLEAFLNFSLGVPTPNLGALLVMTGKVRQNAILHWRKFMKTDEWCWGRELVVWGYDPSHGYTFKIIEPKKGRIGCLSLQYHKQKSETWLCIRGIAWALAVVEGKVCTWLMQPGDLLNLDRGVIHRLMGVSDDVQVAEPSTPDAHAADKSASKDVIRLHCTMGREVALLRSKEEEEIVKTCIEYTEEAIAYIEKDKLPPEHNTAYLLDRGGTRLWR